jgi:hypothetical protein
MTHKTNGSTSPISSVGSLVTGTLYFLFFSALFSRLWPTLFTSLPAPDMVLQPAMNAMASMTATIFVISNMTASLKEARFHAAGKRYSETAGSSDRTWVTEETCRRSAGAERANNALSSGEQLRDECQSAPYRL